MDDLKRILGRKVGGIPVWVIALSAGALLYYLRQRNAPASTAGAGTSGTVTGQVVGQTPAASPLALGPGQSVYDPNSGVLTGTAPGTSQPFALQPGQTVYDPATGKIIVAPVAAGPTQSQYNALNRRLAAEQTAAFNTEAYQANTINALNAQIAATPAPDPNALKGVNVV